MGLRLAMIVILLRPAILDDELSQQVDQTQEVTSGLTRNFAGDSDAANNQESVGLIAWASSSDIP